MDASHIRGWQVLHVRYRYKEGRWPGDDSSRRIGVAVSDSPTGPFILADEPLTDEWSIDAHPFQDSDGTWYMFYNVRNEYTRGPNDVIGCGNVVDKMVTLEKLEGRPSLVCKPEFDHEGTHEGDWYWNEGPFTMRNGNITRCIVEVFSSPRIMWHMQFLMCAEAPMG